MIKIAQYWFRHKRIHTTEDRPTCQGHLVTNHRNAMAMQQWESTRGNIKTKVCGGSVSTMRKCFIVFTQAGGTCNAGGPRLGSRPTKIAVCCLMEIFVYTCCQKGTKMVYNSITHKIHVIVTAEFNHRTVETTPVFFHCRVNK